MLAMMIALGFANALAAGLLSSALGVNIEDGMLAGGIAGVCAGAIRGLRLGIFAPPYAKPSLGEMRACRAAIIIGVALGAIVILRALVAQGNVPMLGLCLFPVFGAFCGGVIGLTVGGIGSDFWAGLRAILLPPRIEDTGPPGPDP
jgi:hypothetical protein